MIHTQRGNEGIDGHTQRTGRGLLWTKEKEEQKERFKCNTMEPTNDASQQLEAVYTEESKKHFIKNGRRNR